MTSHRLPYDSWFDDEKPNPLDSMPVATDEPLDLAPSSVEPQEEDNIHEEMYRMATENGSTIGGGSELVK
jgi:hypothetical protein